MDVVDLSSRAVGVDVGQVWGTRGPTQQLFGTVRSIDPIHLSEHASSKTPTTFKRIHRPEAAPRPQPLAQDGHLLVDVAQARLQRVDLGLALSLGRVRLY